MRVATLLAALVLLPSASAQQAFTVTLETKTAEHPYNGQGHPSGYAVDGVQGATLTLVAGREYRFEMSDIPSNHPMYISTDPAGGGAGVWSDGVTGNGAAGSAVLTFTPPASAAGQTLWYQCEIHTFMGYQLRIVAATDAEGTPTRTRSLALGAENPGARGVRVTLTLAESETARVEVLDRLGRRVAVLHDGPLSASLAHPFEASGLAAGVYVVRARGDGWAETLRVTLAE